MIHQDLGVLPGKQQHARLITAGDLPHDLLTVGQPGEGASGAHDVFDLRQILALGHRAASGGAVDIPQPAGVPLRRLYHGLSGKQLHQLHFFLRFGDGPIGLQGMLHGKALLPALLPELLLADGLHHLPAVDIHAQIPFNRALGLRLG